LTYRCREKFLTARLHCLTDISDVGANGRPELRLDPTTKNFIGSIMATAKKTVTKKTVLKKPPAKTVASKKAPAKKSMPKDATALLIADHKLVSGLFAQFEKTRSDTRKAAIVAQICKELTAHAAIEEEIFYPAVKAALKNHEMVPEANVEHAWVKDLIAQVEDKTPYGEMYDVRVKVMGEFVKHHVREEQNEMFPKARKTRQGLVALGAQMAARKQELMAAQR
jgi:hemerythrin superfamily protein